jgi:hypothetical protein
MTASFRVGLMVRDSLTRRIGFIESKRKSGDLWLVRYCNEHGQPDAMPTLQQAFCFERVRNTRTPHENRST